MALKNNLIVPNDLLIDWKDQKREEWGYDDHLNNFREIVGEIESFPTVEQFLAKVKDVTEFTGSEEEIKEVLNTKSEEAWKDGRGKERLSRGAKQYADKIAQNLNLENKDELTNYFENLARKFVNLFQMTYAGSNYPPNTYEIVNGNNYIKLLTFLENIKKDNRGPLKKYQRLEGGEDASSDDHRDPYKIWGFGNNCFELYGWFNLEKSDVFLYNSKIEKLDFFVDFDGVRDFKDLFKCFQESYSEFMEEKYQNFILPSSKEYLDKLPESFSENEKKNILSHLEIDQFFHFLDKNLSRYWKFSPGEGAKYWDKFREDGRIAIGFLDDKDLSGIEERDDLNKIFKKRGKDLINVSGRVGELYEFIEGISEGDYVLANKGKSEVVGLGKVTSDYKYEEGYNSPHDYPHIREVDWLWTGKEKIDERKGWMATLREIDTEDLQDIKDDLQGIEKTVSQAIENERTYFWVTADPKIWEVSEIKEGGEVFYSAYNRKGNKRRIFQDFEEAEAGDRIIFYEATPSKKIVAEGEVTEGMHYEEEEGFQNEVEGISIRYDKSIGEISWKDLNAVPELSESKPINNRAQGSLFKLTQEEYETILALETEEPREENKKEKLIKVNNAELDLDDQDFTENLFFPENREELNQSISSALKSGKNIIFTGPPGTGKTKLAKNVAESVNGNCDCVDGYIFTTATADWTTFDTIGGYYPTKGDGTLRFKPGHFLRCFKEKNGVPRNNWLLIDEINRADIDKAFGQLFSVLSRDSVELPFTNEDEKSISIRSVNKRVDEDEFRYFDNDFYVTRNWRLLATMNTYDKASLYEMSYAFMRRFAFIDVGIPSLEEIDSGLIDDYISRWDELNKNDFSGDLKEDLADIWKKINEGKRSIGPAIIRDILLFLEEYERKNPIANAVKMYILPQLEGMVKQDQRDVLESLLSTIIDEKTLKKTAKERFEIEDLGKKGD